jgi:hypothetical protein
MKRSWSVMTLKMMSPEHNKQAYVQYWFVRENTPPTIHCCNPSIQMLSFHQLPISLATSQKFQSPTGFKSCSNDRDLSLCRKRTLCRSITDERTATNRCRSESKILLFPDIDLLVIHQIDTLRRGGGGDKPLRFPPCRGIIEDQIYSLLSLCGDGKDMLLTPINSRRESDTLYGFACHQSDIDVKDIGHMSLHPVRSIPVRGCSHNLITSRWS